MIPAIILCGGKGTRMGPEAPPKCLTKVGGVPILSRILDHLAKHGIEKFIICTGYKSDEVMNHFGVSSVDVSYSDAGENADILTRITKAGVGVSKFLVCYGDEFADLDVGELLELHNQSRAYLTMTCALWESPFGVVKVSGDRITDFIEKPSNWVNIGYQVWNMSKLSDLISDGQTMGSLLKSVAKIGRMRGYSFTGKRFTVNEPQDIAKAEAILAE
jgi:glucose-1-phosphate cytidylyltransferase